MSGMGDITWGSFSGMMPEICLCVSAMMLLMFGVYSRNRADSFNITLAILVLGFTAFMCTLGMKEPQVLMNNMFATDAFTGFTKCLVLISGMLVLLLSSSWLKEEGAGRLNLSS